MNNKGKTTRLTKLRRALPALCVGAAVAIGVLSGRSFAKAQSFPRDTQFTARRNDSSPIRSDVVDDLKDRLYQQSERITRLDEKIAVIERTMGNIQSMKLDVVMDRQNMIEQQAKDDAVERRALRTLLITTSVSFVVVLFSSWWNKRSSVGK